MSKIKQLQEAAQHISILYVEDNLELRMSFQHYLSKIFRTVTVCQNGLEGLDAFNKAKFDLVITDINMPEMDGLQMSEIIKKIDENQHIVIVSAYKDLQNYSQAIRIGIDGYLLKPIEYDQLNNTLLKIVTQINHARQNEEYKLNLEKLVAAKTAQIRQYYITDPLTGLYNRNYLAEQLKTNKTKTLILLNIDHFSIINDNFGFVVGDCIIKQAADILKSFQHNGYSLYRLQSDEFAFLAFHESAEGALELAQAIKAYFDIHPVHNDNTNIRLSFTIAIDTGIDKDLLRTTSLTLHEIRHNGKNAIGVYQENSKFEQMQKNNLFWIEKIRDYLLSDAVKVFYQPIMEIATGQIKKYEALVRIISDTGEAIGPDQFLKPLMLAGLSEELTQIVIDRSLAAISGCSVTISINITSQDLKSGYLIDFLEERRKHYQVATYQIILEILESISTLDEGGILNQLKQLKAMRYQIAVDDFGSENSNFSRLLSLEADYIKIDGCFIRNLDNDSNSQEIVKSIVSYAHRSGFKVVAEYVYSESIFQCVRRYGIDFAQGYFIGKPSPHLINNLSSEYCIPEG